MLGFFTCNESRFDFFAASFAIMSRRMPMRATTLVRRCTITVVLLAAAACTSVLVIPDSDNPRYSEVIIAGQIQNSRIIEASGLARSNRHNEILWTMNDDGPPVVYAIGTDGSDVGSLTLRHARNVDWEDLAAFELDGTPYLLIADTGDNEANRPYATIYVVEEPEISRGQHIAAEPA